MKTFKATALVVLGLFVCALQSQAENKTLEFNVNGLKVILKQTQKETIVMSMYFRGGLSNYPAKNAGIESLALSGLTSCGTKTLSSNKVDEQCDEYNLGLTTEANSDFSSITLKCISRYVNEGWSVFSSALAAPSFEPRRFELLRAKKIDIVQSKASSPDIRLERLAIETAFANSLYTTDPNGTAESLAGLPLDTVKNYYYNTLLNKNRMFLVVAGNISREDLETKIQAAFSSLPSRPYEEPKIQPELFSRDVYKAENRQVATTYICGLINAPQLNHNDYPAYKIASILLHSAIFREIRINKQLSYAPRASISMGRMPYLTMYASTSQPGEAVKTMVATLNRVKQVTYTDATIEELRKSFIQSDLKRQEKMAAIVESLGEAEILGGWHLAEDMANRASSVTGKDVRNALQYYSQHIAWAFLGDSSIAEQTFNPTN